MGILDGIVEWIAEQIMAGLDLVTTSVLGALGCDMTVFLRYFPAAETMYNIFVALAIGMILLNLIWQLFKNYGLIAGVEAEDPVKLTIRSVLFILLAVIAWLYKSAVNEKMNKSLWPILGIFFNIFAVMAFLTFATSSSWGLYVLAMPIVFPISIVLGVSTPLMIGALLSASSFGSHACFFSDSSLLAAQGAGCSPMQHAFTQFPYAMLGAGLSVVTFLGLGYMMA